MQFVGIQCLRNGLKLQQYVRDEKGRLLQKTSDIIFWFVYSDGNSSVYIPVTKYDLTSEPCIVESQICAAANDKTRCIIGKNSEGNMSIVALGAIYRY